MNGRGTADQPRFKVASANIVNETFDDETVIVNLDSGAYFSLTSLASAVWTALPGSTAHELVSALSARYPDAGEEVGPAVGAFLAALEAEGLVVATHGPVPAPAPLPEGPPCFEAPRFEKFDDMQDLLLLDPIHDVDETGWPTAR